MVSIQTKYLAPTNRRGARVKAWTMQPHAYRQSVTIPWDHSLDARDNHKNAVMALLRKTGWESDHYTRHGIHIGSTEEGIVAVLGGESLIWPMTKIRLPFKGESVVWWEIRRAGRLIFKWEYRDRDGQTIESGNAYEHHFARILEDIARRNGGAS